MTEPLTAADLDYVHTLQRAKTFVRTSDNWRFMDHTPLENDVAVWMADFAFQFLADCLAVGTVIAPGPVLSPPPDEAAR